MCSHVYPRTPIVILTRFYRTAGNQLSLRQLETDAPLKCGCIGDLAGRLRSIGVKNGKARGMTRSLIRSGSPFEAQIGYSRAVVDGDFIFVFGASE